MAMPSQEMHQKRKSVQFPPAIRPTKEVHEIRAEKAVGNHNSILGLTKGGPEMGAGMPPWLPLR